MKTQNKSGQANSYSYFLGTYPISRTSYKELQVLQGGKKPDEPESFSKCNNCLPLTNYHFSITMQSDNRQVHILSCRWCSVTWEHRLSPAISQPLILKPPESSSHISPLPHLSCFLSCPDLSSVVSADNQLGSGAVFPEVSYLSQQVGSLIKKKKKTNKTTHPHAPIKPWQKRYTLAAVLPGPAKGERCCIFWGNKKVQAFLPAPTQTLPV